MNIHIKRNGIYEFGIVFLLFTVVWMSAYTAFGLTDQISQVVSMWVVVIGSGFVLLVFWRTAGRLQGMILFIGYLLRCVCILVDIYGRKYMTLLHSGGDSEGFAQNAIDLYRGIKPEYVSTRYPYAISWIYHVFGENRFCAQYMNVVLWVLSVAVLIRVCHRFQMKENKKSIIFILWTLLPTGMILSGILLRESAEMFFGIWSFERFLCWMQEGDRKYSIQAFIYVVPAILLHSASVALWAAYIVVMMFWDTKKGRYRWQKKTIFIFIVSVAILIFCWETPVGKLLFSKLGTDFSLYGITHGYYVKGGSDYLLDMDCQSWLAFVPDTLLRMFYFLFSPLPTEARGYQDLAMFAVDGLPLAGVIGIVLFCAHKNKNIQGYAYAGLLGGFSFAGIFAWGVRNAGTALRHRYLAWSIFILALCIAFGGIDEQKKRRL